MWNRNTSLCSKTCFLQSYSSIGCVENNFFVCTNGSMGYSFNRSVVCQISRDKLTVSEDTYWIMDSDLSEYYCEKWWNDITFGLICQCHVQEYDMKWMSRTKWHFHSKPISEIVVMYSEEFATGEEESIRLRKSNGCSKLAVTFKQGESSVKDLESVWIFLWSLVDALLREN